MINNFLWVKIGASHDKRDLTLLKYIRYVTLYHCYLFVISSSLSIKLISCRLQYFPMNNFYQMKKEYSNIAIIFLVNLFSNWKKNIHHYGDSFTCLFIFVSHYHCYFFLFHCLHYPHCFYICIWYMRIVCEVCLWSVALVLLLEPSTLQWGIRISLTNAMSTYIMAI